MLILKFINDKIHRGQMKNFVSVLDRRIESNKIHSERFTGRFQEHKLDSTAIISHIRLEVAIRSVLHLVVYQTKHETEFMLSFDSVALQLGMV